MEGLEKRLTGIEASLQYQTKLLEEVLDLISSRGDGAAKQRKMLNEQMKRMYSMMLNLPNVSGNEKATQMVKEMFAPLIDGIGV